MSERNGDYFIDFIEIQEELERAIDKHSKDIIASTIELLLNHCQRFYDRQFITRENINKDILVRFENLLSDYFESDQPQNCRFAHPCNMPQTDCIFLLIISEI